MACPLGSVGRNLSEAEILPCRATKSQLTKDKLRDRVIVLISPS